MSDTTLILLAAGSSNRFELQVKKQWLRIDHKPLWQFLADKCGKTKLFAKIIITSSNDDISSMRNYADFTFVEGSRTRQLSLKNALKLVDTKYVLVSDVARACISKDFLTNILSYKGKSDCIVPYLKVNDTITYDDKTIDRDKVKRIQTPQLSTTSVLKAALDTKEEFTDESSAIVANGGNREFILGEQNAHKITHYRDLKELSCLHVASSDTLSGTGFDVHVFGQDKVMFLAGVKIEVDYGFIAHSDGDVAIHSLIDALLGAAGLGDIGMLFPDNDDIYKGIDSKELLKKIATKVYSFGFVIVNVDLTIVAQKPRIGNYKLEMRKTLSKILHVDMSRVNIKATTTEKLGFIGRGEGVGVIANANLKYFDWSK